MPAKKLMTFKTTRLAMSLALIAIALWNLDEYSFWIKCPTTIAPNMLKRIECEIPL